MFKKKFIFILNNLKMYKKIRLEEVWLLNEISSKIKHDEGCLLNIIIFWNILKINFLF